MVSAEKDRRSRVIAWIVIGVLLLVFALGFADYQIGKRQMKKGIETLWKGEGELAAIRHFEKAGIVIRQPGAEDMIRFCHAQYAYVEEKDHLKAMMYAREIDKNNLLRLDLTSAVAYDIIVDRLSEHFRELEDYSAGLPYVGMPESGVDLTCMGKPDHLGFEYMFYNGSHVRTRVYHYYDNHNQYLFTAWCYGGRVIAIDDHTSNPLDENPYEPEKPKSTPNPAPRTTPAPSGGRKYPGWSTNSSGDPYGASGYSNPDDFYDDYYPDFDSYDEAEEYWIDHEYD